MENNPLMEASPVPGMPTRERIASPVPGLPTGERIAGIVPEEEISGKGKERIPLLPALTVDWVLFLLCWPFGALVSALRRLGMPEAKTVIFFFCLYFGFVFIYGDPCGTKFEPFDSRFKAFRRSFNFMKLSNFS